MSAPSLLIYRVACTNTFTQHHTCVHAQIQDIARISADEQEPCARIRLRNDTLGFFDFWERIDGVVMAVVMVMVMSISCAFAFI